MLLLLFPHSSPGSSFRSSVPPGAYAPEFSSINNKLGARLTLLLGTSGYALYIGSYLYALQFTIMSTPSNYSLQSAMNIHPNAGGFVIGAGAVLGICAGLLWTAQGSLMLAYPTEGQKGQFIAIFWSIFNLGGVVGASVSLGENFHSKVSLIVFFVES